MYHVVFSVIKLLMITPATVYLLSIFITEFSCSIDSCNSTNSNVWQLPFAMAPIVILLAIVACFIGYQFRKRRAMEVAR